MNCIFIEVICGRRLAADAKSHRPIATDAHAVANADVDAADL